MAFKTLVVAIALSMVSSLKSPAVTAKSPAVTAAHKAAAKPVEKVAVKAAAKSADKPVEKVAVTAADKPAEKVGVLKAEQPAEKAGVVGFDTVTSDVKLKAAVAASGKLVTPKDEPQLEEWVPQDPTEGNSLSGAFVAVCSLLMFAMIPLLIIALVLVMTQARHALLSAGFISADGPITKLSLKASGVTAPLKEQLGKLPMVQEALAAMGLASRGGEEDQWGSFAQTEKNQGLINESDGEDEEDAEVVVQPGSLSRPMGNVAERKPDDDLIDLGSSPPDAPAPCAPAPCGHQAGDLIDFDSSPQQKAPLPETQIQANFIADDFFDEDDF